MFNINIFNSNFDKIDYSISDKQSKNDVLYNDSSGSTAINIDTSEYSSFKIFMMIAETEKIYFSETISGTNVISVTLHNADSVIIGNIICTVTDTEISVSQLNAYEIITGNTSSIDILIKKVIGVK